MNPYRENDNIPIPITKPAFWVRHGLKLAAFFFASGGFGAGVYSIYWKMSHIPPRPTSCVEEVKANNDWSSACAPGAHVEKMGDYYFVCRCTDK